MKGIAVTIITIALCALYAVTDLASSAGVSKGHSDSGSSISGGGRRDGLEAEMSESVL